MKRIWLAGLLLVGAAMAAHAQGIAGDWQGTLKDGTVDLRTVVHIVSEGGVLKGTVDSPDQDAYAIPLTSLSFGNAKLIWGVTTLHATYEGVLNAQGDLIKGTFTQNGAALPLDFKRVAGPPVTPTDIDGVWNGMLYAGPQRLRLAFHFFNTADGLKATLDSLDQGANGIPVSSVTRNGDNLKLVLKAIGATYEARIQLAKGTVSGTFTQNAEPLPLMLTRSKDGGSSEPKRPQNPVKPYPYREEEVAYDNPSAQGVKLAGTFTIPKGKGPFTAVLLITGSGPQDRDETLMGHKPFLVLSDYLTRHGIAVLRVDDRGIGKSTGNFRVATTADFAIDAEAGVSWLKTRPEVNHARIGLIGHSEGGEIAPMVAARNHDVGFIVMLAGTGVPGDQLLVAQVMASNEAGGMSHENAVKSGELERQILKAVEAQNDPAELRKQLAAYLPKDQIDRQAAALSSPWFRYFIEHDPAVDLRKVTCPVLALNGSKDTQVPAKQNLPAIRAALDSGGNKRFETAEMPGLNHLFQTAKSGAVSEYATIEETMSPAVLEKITSWIQALK